MASQVDIPEAQFKTASPPQPQSTPSTGGADQLLPIAYYQVDDITIDRFDDEAGTGVQREFVKAWVEDKLAGPGYKRTLVGTITVNVRQDGVVSCLDGQNRLTLARRAGHGNDVVRCVVYHGLDRAQEAEVMEEINDATPVRKSHKFKLRVARGELKAIEINNVVENSDWRIGTGMERIGAVRPLEDLFDLAEWLLTDDGVESQGWGSIKLAETLMIMAGVRDNGSPAGANSGGFLRLIGEFLVYYHDVVDLDHLLSVAKSKGNAKDLMRAARDNGEFADIKSSFLAQMHGLITFYNKKRPPGVPQVKKHKDHYPRGDV